MIKNLQRPLAVDIVAYEYHEKNDRIGCPKSHKGANGSQKS
jgi:hypothetical protein